MIMRGGNEPLAKKENQMNKLIFASLLSVGAILAAQTPAAPAPAASAKPATSSKVKIDQEASQQEDHRGHQHQRQTRREVIATATVVQLFTPGVGRPLIGPCSGR